MKRLAVFLVMLAGVSVWALGGQRVSAQQGPIKIGVVLSYSGGDNVTLGKMADAAFAAYMKEHGDTIAGRKIEFIKRDDTGIAPEIATRLAQELIVQENVDLHRRRVVHAQRDRDRARSRPRPRSRSSSSTPRRRTS